MNDVSPLVCVVDDDLSVRESIAELARSAGLVVESYSSAQEFLEKPRLPAPECLVLDVKMPGLTGLELQDRLERDQREVPIVFVSGQSDVPMSVQALKAGALDFLIKPFDPDRLLAAIWAGVAASRAQPGGGRRAANTEPGERSGAGLGIVGRSAALDRVLDAVRTVADTDATVLIQGETGTGKELVARAIHEASSRKSGPFVKLNCGAIPPGLLESELMGHERGAFTGAIAQRIGRFELAHGGTLFLDEIGELALELQPKLLRLLQEREFERVGGTRTVRSNARLVAATNRDLSAMVDARTFREDLFYRLNVFPIGLPPLRERREDIPALVDHFMRRLAARMKKDVRGVSPEALARLQQHDWPGNIRELENVVERALILSCGTTLEVAPMTPRPAAPQPMRYDDCLDSLHKAQILGALEASGWIVGGPYGAAARLGVNRSTLNHRMKKLGIQSVRARARVEAS
jgi:DNA-binding NtrC family response regulator